MSSYGTEFSAKESAKVYERDVKMTLRPVEPSRSVSMHITRLFLSASGSFASTLQICQPPR
jgi:hypothetical protein